MRRADGNLELWYALGRLYCRAEGSRRRSARLGFTATLLSGALFLLSVPLFGAFWLGSFAPAVPAVVGLASGFGMFGVERFSMRRRESSIREALAERGLDARRPGRRGLSAYYDTQLVLLRSEYEYVLGKGAKRSSRLFEESFGFTPEDGFETGPLNILTDTEGMRSLRTRWERRLSMRLGRGMDPPGIGLREDLAYRVFPREMTVRAERAARRAYLAISRDAIRSRYGRNPAKNDLPEETKARIHRDLREYDELTGRPSGWRLG